MNAIHAMGRNIEEKTVYQMEKSEKCEHGIENFELF